MTKTEWLACRDPGAMLHLLAGKVSQRKRYLFASACCRRIWALLPDKHCRRALELCERFADGLASEGEVEKATEAAMAGGPDDSVVAHLARSAIQSAAIAECALVCEYVARALEGEQAAGEVCAILRETFYYPLRPPGLAPACLAWSDSLIPKLARASYEERAFDRLPILADALEDAGGASAEVLAHLRGPGPHVRGCWALDLLLAKT